MTDDNQALRNIQEDTLAPPRKSRIGNVTAIRSRINEMRRHDLKRANNRRKIQRLIDGERPLDQAKLVDLGQGDRTNFNPREAEGMADAAKTPFYSLIFRNARFASIQTDYGDQMQRRAEWSDKISRSFHQMLESWDEHDYYAQLYQWQMCVFGVGITMWMDEKNWQWEVRKLGDFLVPNRTPSNVKKFAEASIRRIMNPVDLWKLIENEKTAKAMGWFPDRVKKALVKAAPLVLRGQGGFGDQWTEEYQASLRRGDFIWNGGTSEILVDDYLGKEFDGKISHTITIADGGQETSDRMEDEGLLFKRIGRYECFEQVVCPFFFDIGTGEFHSVKGLGPKIFDFCMASARMLCALIDGGIRSAALLLEATDANAMQQTQLITLNGATVVQPGFKVVQQRLGESLNGMLEAKREVSGILQSNTGQYRERVALENQEPTLGQAQLNARNQMSLSESSVDRYCKTLDRQYKEVFRRAAKLGVSLYKKRKPTSGTQKPEYDESDEGAELAYEMVARCVAGGVPIEALEMGNICSVRATRGLGSGSPVGQDMATQGMMGLLPMADERGRRNILRMRSAFLIGQGNVDGIFPEFDEADVPNDHEWAAQSENNDMTNPLAKLEITPRQDHLIHFTKHFEFGSNIIQAVQAQQFDPMQALTILHVAGPHMKGHLNAMMGDPTREAQIKPLERAWQALSKIADQMQQQVDEAQKAQQKNAPPPQPDPQLVAALAKVSGDLKIKQFKAQGDMQLKAEKQAQTLRLKDISQAHTMRLSNVDQMHQMGLENIKTQADLAAPATAK